MLHIRQEVDTGRVSRPPVEAMDIVLRVLQQGMSR